jgi:hypothetical protein
VDRFFRKHNISATVTSVFKAVAYRNGENPSGLLYSRRDDHALLIPGNADRYMGFVRQFREFLIDELDFPPENILDFSEPEGEKIESDKITVDDLRDSSRRLRAAAGEYSNLVIYYSGHGDVGCFQFNKEELGYKEWAHPLVGHEGNIIFINDSCHADTSRKALYELGLLPNRLLLLNATSSEERGDTNVFSYYVMESYRNRRKPQTREIKINRPVAFGIVIGKTKDGIVEPLGMRSIEIVYSQTYSRIGPDFDYMLMKY